MNTQRRNFEIRHAAPVHLGRGGARTVIVTGGAGFLGSHLCRTLLAGPAKVVCVDNLLTGRLSNIADLLGNEAFQFIHHDIIHPIRIEGTVDQIYNLASPASPPVYQRDPLHTFKSSVFGAMNMLELARAKGARILQASTSEVYGDPLVSPQPEAYFGNVNTLGPRACYDEGKRAAETLFYDMHHTYGVETRIARIFNTYGPNMCPQDGRVVSNLIVQALAGDDLTINGDGTQTRSFCYRDDLVRGLILLMNSDAAGVEAVNLGNPGEFTILQLAEMVLAKVGGASRLTYAPLPIDDPLQRRPDISRAQELLHWRPEIALDDGLDRTIAHFKHALRHVPETPSALEAPVLC